MGTRRPPAKIVHAIFGGVLVLCWPIFNDFLIFFRIFWARWMHLKPSSRFFIEIFRFFMDFERILGRFGEDFSMIYRISFKNADLQHSCAHAVFRKGRAVKIS